MEIRWSKTAKNYRRIESYTNGGTHSSWTQNPGHGSQTPHTIMKLFVATLQAVIMNPHFISGCCKLAPILGNRQPTQTAIFQFIEFKCLSNYYSLYKAWSNEIETHCINISNNFSPTETEEWEGALLMQRWRKSQKYHHIALKCSMDILGSPWMVYQVMDSHTSRATLHTSSSECSGCGTGCLEVPLRHPRKEVMTEGPVLHQCDVSGVFSSVVPVGAPCTWVAPKGKQWL